MKHLLATATLAVVAFFGFAQSSEAHGGKFRSSCGGCDSGYMAAPCGSPCGQMAAPVEARWEERKVTRYKPVMTERDIEVVECRRVTREEKFNYTVCVPVTREEKRKVTVCVPVQREVEYMYTVMVPRTIQKTIQCTNWVCERVMINEQVPVCRTVCVTFVDECGRCCTRRERVTVMENVTRCVVKRTPVVTEQVVNVVVCEPVQQKGKRMICEMVPQEREVTVQICDMVQQQREGTRLVCDLVQQKVMRKVQVCEMVAYEDVVRVMVGGCYNTCYSPCNDCCNSCGSGYGYSGGHGHRRGCCR